MSEEEFSTCSQSVGPVFRGVLNSCGSLDSTYQPPALQCRLQALLHHPRPRLPSHDSARPSSLQQQATSLAGGHKQILPQGLLTRLPSLREVFYQAIPISVLTNSVCCGMATWPRVTWSPLGLSAAMLDGAASMLLPWNLSIELAQTVGCGALGCAVLAGAAHFCYSCTVKVRSNSGSHSC